MYACVKRDMQEIAMFFGRGRKEWDGKWSELCKPFDGLNLEREFVCLRAERCGTMH